MPKLETTKMFAYLRQCFANRKLDSATATSPTLLLLVYSHQHSGYKQSDDMTATYVVAEYEISGG
jgi:hypothetical protein